MSEEVPHQISIGEGLTAIAIAIGYGIKLLALVWFITFIGGCIERSDNRKAHPQAVIP